MKRICRFEVEDAIKFDELINLSNFIYIGNEVPFLRLTKDSQTNGPMLSEWTIRETTVSKYRNGISFRLNGMAVTHALTANNDFSVIGIPRNVGMQSIKELLLMAMRFRMLHLGGIVAHGSVVVHNGIAIMFCGASGAGKSTQANLWCEYVGSWVLNYDKPILQVDGGRVLVSGSPWSGKEDCFINLAFPLAAIVFVNQACNNSIS